MNCGRYTNSFLTKYRSDSPKIIPLKISAFAGKIAYKTNFPLFFLQMCFLYLRGHLILEDTVKNVVYSSERTYNKELAMLVEIVVVLPLPKIKDFWDPITISQESLTFSCTYTFFFVSLQAN